MLIFYQFSLISWLLPSAGGVMLNAFVSTIYDEFQKGILNYLPEWRSSVFFCWPWRIPKEWKPAMETFYREYQDEVPWYAWYHANWNIAYSNTISTQKFHWKTGTTNTFMKFNVVPGAGGPIFDQWDDPVAVCGTGVWNCIELETFHFSKVQ